MIELNYKEVLEQAKELESISEELSQLINEKLSPELGELQSVWSGDGANLFCKKSGELFGDITKTAKSAGDIARGVQKAAETIRDAEEAAKKVISVISP